MNPVKIFWSIFAIVGIVILSDAFVYIKDDSVGVKKRFGTEVGTVSSGFHFKIPIIETVSVVKIGKVKVVVPDDGNKTK